MLSGAAAGAECVLPASVEIPDGSSATTEAMLASQVSVKEFMAQMEEYLDCLDYEEETLPEKQTPEAKQLHTQLHNAAVDQMETTAAKFNEQIREYKKAN